MWTFLSLAWRHLDRETAFANRKYSVLFKILDDKYALIFCQVRPQMCQGRSVREHCVQPVVEDDVEGRLDLLSVFGLLGVSSTTGR